jgi:hypothetical protein
VDIPDAADTKTDEIKKVFAAVHGLFPCFTEEKSGRTACRVKAEIIFDIISKRMLFSWIL